MDLVHAIRCLYSHLPIRILFQHVGSHQDHNASYETLPCLAQLNIDMDHKTKAKLQSLIAANAPPLPIAGNKYEGWHCEVDGTKITTDPAAAIRFAVYSAELQDHFHQ